MRYTQLECSSTICSVLFDRNRSRVRYKPLKKLKKEPDQPKAHTIRDGPVKSTKPKPRLRGEYNPLTGAGGGSSKFSSGRKAPSRGG